MNIIAHLSDMHFGTEDPALVTALAEEVRALEPSLVIVSGDLTQRARESQFLAARSFLQQLPRSQLVVPGNHDIPLFDLWSRFFVKLGRYQRCIQFELNPFYAADGLAVLGLNTVRSNTWKEGRISLTQIAMIEEKFRHVPEGWLRIVVTHHPFIPPPGDPSLPVVGRRRLALTKLEEANVDLLLAGHLHQGYTGQTRSHYVERTRSILVVQAGTACSRRTRGEPNAFNVITHLDGRLDLRTREWTGESFKAAACYRWIKTGEGWIGG